MTSLARLRRYFAFSASVNPLAAAAPLRRYAASGAPRVADQTVKVTFVSERDGARHVVPALSGSTLLDVAKVGSSHGASKRRTAIHAKEITEFRALLAAHGDRGAARGAISASPRLLASPRGRPLTFSLPCTPTRRTVFSWRASVTDT